MATYCSQPTITPLQPPKMTSTSIVETSRSTSSSGPRQLSPENVNIMNSGRESLSSYISTMLALLLFGVAAILIVISWTLLKRDGHKDEPPLCDGSKILLGHALLFTGTSVRLWNNIIKIGKECLDRGGALKVKVLFRTLYVLADPEDCTAVSNICLQKDGIYEFAKPWVGDGLVTSSAGMWKVHRKLLNPSFNPHVIDSFIDAFNSKSRKFVSNLKAEVGRGLFDQRAYAKMFALETACLTTLGMDLSVKSEANTEFIESIETILNILISRFQTFWLHSDFIFSLSSLKRKQDACIKKLHTMSNNILRERKENFFKQLTNVEHVEDQQKGPRFKPFMELLLELAHDTNAFTDREIREHVDTMLVAGHDTFATAIVFITMFVGANPQVQEKIHEELKSIFGDEDRDVTKQDLSQLVYLDAVIKETLRLYPIGPVIGRYLTQDIKLRNCTLYKGNSVFMSLYSVHRHSVWGPDAEVFRPERWLDPFTLPESPNASVSFGLGRRNCIGKSYAMHVMKIAMVHFFRNYIVHGEHSNLKLKLDVFLQPVSGYYVRIENRI